MLDIIDNKVGYTPISIAFVAEVPHEISLPLEAAEKLGVYNSLRALPKHILNIRDIPNKLQVRVKKGPHVSRNILAAAKFGVRLLESDEVRAYRFTPKSNTPDSRSWIYRVIIDNPNISSVVKTSLILPVLKDWHLLVSEYKNEENLKELVEVIDSLLQNKLVDKYSAAVMGSEIGIPFGLLNGLFSANEMKLWNRIKMIYYSTSKFELKLVHIAQELRDKRIDSPFVERFQYDSPKAVIIDFEQEAFDRGIYEPLDVSLGSPRPSFSHRIFSPVSSRKDINEAIDMVLNNLTRFYEEVNKNN